MHQNSKQFIICLSTPCFTDLLRLTKTRYADGAAKKAPPLNFSFVSWLTFQLLPLAVSISSVLMKVDVSTMMRLGRFNLDAQSSYNTTALWLQYFIITPQHFILHQSENRWYSHH
jgi:hypothetical protein